MMIDWEKSVEFNGCSVEWLKARFEKYPKSNKKVWAICDECGKERLIIKQQYRSLCLNCAWKKGYAKEKIMVKCDNCGKDIEKLKYQLNKNEHHFCNSQCQGEWQSKNICGKNHPNYIERILVKCDNCGKDIERQKWELDINKHNFCCNKCVGEYFSDESSHHYKERILVKCDNCGGI